MPFVAHTRNTTGKVENYFTVTGTSPRDPRWGGVVAYYLRNGAPTSEAVQLTGVIGGVVEQPTQFSQDIWFDAPAAIETGKVYFVSQDYLGRQNTLVPGVTPSFDIQIGVAGGTVDLGAAITSSVGTALSIVTGVLGVATGGITTSLLDDFAVTQGKLQNAQIIDAGRIVDAAVQTAKLNDSAVTTNKIAALAVTTAKIDNLAVTNAKIDNLAVDGAKIANAAITTAKIANAQITTALIANLAITNALIADAAISTAKIGDLQVTSGKIVSLDVAKLTTGSMLVNSTTDGIIVRYVGNATDTRIWPGYIDGRYQGTTVNWYASTSSLGGYIAVKNQYGNEIAALRADGSSPDAENGLRVNGLRVVGPRLGGITGPSGGSFIDTQARAVIDLILNRLQTHGLIS